MTNLDMAQPKLGLFPTTVVSHYSCAVEEGLYPGGYTSETSVLLDNFDIS